MQKQAPPINGYIIWSSGVLLFSLIESIKPNPAVLVGHGTLEGLIGFTHHLNKKQVPTTTNIHAIRHLYNQYCLNQILKENGIDMQPATEPDMAKNNFKALTSLKLVNNSVLVSARKLFKRVAGVFNLKSRVI